jgi:hypothetical protein
MAYYFTCKISLNRKLDIVFLSKKYSASKNLQRVYQDIMSSDLSLVMNMLDGLANSVYLQQGDFSGDGTKKLMEEKYIQFNTTLNSLFIVDKDDVVTISLAPKRSDIFVGADYSFRDWVKETRSSLRPVFSDGFERQGIYRIFISFPIINRQTQESLGIVGT